MSAIRQVAKKLLTACLPRERLIVRGPHSTNGKPELALTFDDGPHPEWTPRLLDRLDKLDLRATFYVIGNLAEQYPEIIRRIADSGHELGNHTYSHSEPSQTSSEKFLDEIRQTDDVLNALTGRVTQTVRPPKGELAWNKLRGIWRFQKTVALWNVDPKDFRMKSTSEMDAWFKSYKPADGDIVLLHDNHPYACQAVDLMASNGTFDKFESTAISRWLRRREN